jgi:ATP-dependent DNA helicase DinG
LVRLGLRPLAQGEAQRSDLLQRFREAPGGVLFGTDSFWEGVDVKGRALEQVILTRLPFRVPSEPLQEARIEDLERRGKDPFRDFTVPQAVLKFKQGFGRLIRAATDRGVVAVLDSRILGKSYGRLFLASLPRTRVCADTEDLVVRQVEAFFGEALANPAEETAAAPAVREAAPTTEEPLPWK